MSRIEVRSAGMCVLGDRLLLVNHERAGRSYWVLPGGRVEHGETLDAALRREMKEELTLEVTVGPLVIVHDFISERRHVVVNVFRVDVEHAEFTVNQGPRLKAARWVELAQLDQLDLLPPIADHVRRILTNPPTGPVYLGNI